ncbi:DUF1772 domain-containing protein [Streptomyces sp. NPDC091292]|uniref:anthrone oxygenase family protein n=1 Tax=Streptomyces sp. NPDC091292 TaxID=3365991 RepID=UPI003818BEB8
MDTLYFGVTLAAAIACGLTAGALYAFSTFVMKGLTALPPAQGIAAMQAINKAAPSPGFMLVFLGGALLSAAVAVVTFVAWPDRGAAAGLIGCGLYLFGSFGVSVAAHFPRNDALDKIAPESPESAPYWTTWAREWTRWNHVRTALALAASASFTLALTG